VLGAAQEESANKDTVVAQSQGVSPLSLVLWNRLIAQTNSWSRQRRAMLIAARSSQGFVYVRLA
jgi:hypothetical protein